MIPLMRQSQIENCREYETSYFHGKGRGELERSECDQ